MKKPRQPPAIRHPPNPLALPPKPAIKEPGSPIPSTDPATEPPIKGHAPPIQSKENQS